MGECPGSGVDILTGNKIVRNEVWVLMAQCIPNLHKNWTYNMICTIWQLCDTTRGQKTSALQQAKYKYKFAFILMFKFLYFWKKEKS